MAQTTAGFSAVDALVEISTNGTLWTDISGFGNNVEPDGGDRKLGEAYTFEGDTAIISKGKREPIDVKVRVVYTEGASDPYATVLAAYENGTPLYLRWSPKGGGSGENMYTTDPGYVTGAIYPAVDGESEDLIFTEFTLRTAKITKSTVAP